MKLLTRLAAVMVIAVAVLATAPAASADHAPNHPVVDSIQCDRRGFCAVQTHGSAPFANHVREAQTFLGRQFGNPYTGYRPSRSDYATTSAGAWYGDTGCTVKGGPSWTSRLSEVKPTTVVTSITLYAKLC